MEWPDDMPFATRAYPVDNRAEGVITGYWKTLGLALDAGKRDAFDERFRGVQVIDQAATLYAQFNILWMVPSEHA